MAVMAVLALTTILDKHHNYFTEWQQSSIDLSRQTALLDASVGASETGVWPRIIWVQAQ